MKQLIKIKRALFSVSDKSGVEALARALHENGCQIISTGGTKSVLEKAGIPVTEISEVTGNPEAFGGRMKTISFQIESALLFDREKDADEARRLGIEPIDMVVCNLYPFERVKNQGVDFDTLIENIDIGGPTMARAAAKNFKYVAVVTDPQDYPDLVKELQENDGALSYETRFRLMRKAFNLTADYDAAIATTMDEMAGELSVRLAFHQAKTLRYGENSHQHAFFLRQRKTADALHDLQFLHGKELSYNNIVDLYSALDAVKDFTNTACAIIKHNNPCGLCEGSDQREVFELAWAGDPVSAFGSVIAFNRRVELETARFLQLDAENKMQRKFVEVIAAPDFDPEAIEYLKQHKNLRLVRFEPKRVTQEKEFKILAGSLLLQTTDNKLLEKKETVTQLKTDVGDDLLNFGLLAVRQLKSNAIAVVRKKDNCLQLLGMGCGQPNRVNSTRLALERSRENLKNEFTGEDAQLERYIKEQMGKAVLVSDAFFPFPDNVEIAASYGIKTIVQPGGSIRDKSVIEKCNELGLSMIFTGVRHFKH
ncbi:bifunctional phosphoribosylaminoimidazolecarboxamide formyltransferase/IMP cyclohydrolase [Calditrichota bacterium LG25]